MPLLVLASRMMTVHPDTSLMLVALVLAGAAFGLLARTLHVSAASWWAATWMAAAGATAALAKAGRGSAWGCWLASLLILVAVLTYVAGAARVTGRPLPVGQLGLASAGWTAATLLVRLGQPMVGATLGGLVHLVLQGVVAGWCLRAPRHEGGGVLCLFGAPALAVGIVYLLLSPFSPEGKLPLSWPAEHPAIFGLSLVLAFVQIVAVTGFYHRRAKLRDQAVREQSIAMVERERSTIAQELHDGACQALMVSKLELEQAVRQEVPAAAHSSLREAARGITRVIDDLREMSHSLYPSGLTALGFERAVGELVKGAESDSRRAYLLCDLQGPPLAPPVELALYPILQEALHNVAHHSNATDVRVRIVAWEGMVSVAVEDNGVGFDAERVSGGMGLASMRERAEALGGTLEVEAQPGCGVALRVTVLQAPRAPTGAGGDMP